MEAVVFVVCALIVVAGAVGVVLFRNPVQAALSLVATLFGVAVLFIAQKASFLAAVQVIVYAGAIVVLFLFVIMLLGVDQAEDLRVDPLGGQRPASVVVGVATLGLVLVVILATLHHPVTGDRRFGVEAKPDVVEVAHQPGADRAKELANASDGVEPNITQLGKLLFTDYVFAFESTAILLTIAVVGAVVLARRAPKMDDLPAPATGEARV